MQAILRSIQAGKFKMVLFLVVLALGTVGVIPTVSSASTRIVTSDDISSARARNVEKILAFVETKEVSEKLLDLGIDPASVKNSIRQLSDEEISGGAARLDRIKWDDSSSSLPNSGSSDVVTYLLVALGVLLVVGVIYYLVKRNKDKAPEPEAKAATEKVEPVSLIPAAI